MKDVTTVGVSSIYTVSTVSSLGEICGDQVYLIWECGGVADRGLAPGQMWSLESRAITGLQQLGHRYLL